MTESLVSGIGEVDRVESFIDTLPLDGTIIPLQKGVYGMPLSLMARHVKVPFTSFGDLATHINRDRSFLLFNIFADADDRFVNVGYMDWEISNGSALCEHQQSNIKPQSPLEQTAVNEYEYNFLQGYHVSEIFRGKGIGDFLIALSLATLPKLSVTSIYPGANVTEEAIPRWKKFGINTPESPKNPFPLLFATAHPRVKTSIAAFV
jgi:hypothetical protein